MRVFFIHTDIYVFHRSVFGANVGPRQVVPANAIGTEPSTSKLFVYEGLQVRAKPLNVTVTPSTLTQSARTPSSPILKAQLSSPSSPNVSKKDVKSKVCKSVTKQKIIYARKRTYNSANCLIIWCLGDCITDFLVFGCLFPNYIVCITRMSIRLLFVGHYCCSLYRCRHHIHI